MDGAGAETDPLDTMAFDLTLGAVDNTPPQVALRTPAVDAYSVSVDSSVTVEFSEPLDVASVTSANIYLTPSTAAVASLGADHKTVTLNPNANLAYSTVYTVNLKAGGITDAAGNAIAAASTWSFSTVPNLTVAPSVLATTPGDRATGVSVDSDFEIMIDRPLDAASFLSNIGSIKLRRGSSGSTYAPVSWAGAEVDGKYVIKGALPTGTKLEYNTIYYFVIDGSKFKDENGRYLAAFSRYFTTEASPTPTITDRDPDANETGVDVDQSVKIKFSKALTASTVTTSTVYLTKGTSTTKLGALVSYSSSSQTVTLNPSADLLPNTVYYVHVTTGVKDTDGVAVAKTDWKFTTGVNDIQATDMDPDDGDEDVPVDTRITFEFTDDIDWDTLDSSSVYLTKEGSSTKISTTLTWDEDDRTVTLTPKANLAYDTEYEVHLTDDIEDEDGYALEATEWTFTTMDDDYPHLVSRDPAEGGTGFPIDGTITVEFASAMTSSTIGTSSFYLKKKGSSTKIAADVDYDSSERTATLTPDNPLLPDTEYTVTITDDVEDQDDVAIAEAVWTFRTAADLATISSLDPADQAKNVSVDKTISFKFSKAMQAPTITSANIFLHKDGSATKVSAVLSYDSSTRTVSLNPDSPLAAGTRYNLSVSNGVKDSSGNAITSQTFSFTTAAAPVTPDPDRKGTAQRPLVRINGKYLNFTDVHPYTANSRVMIPFRALFEALGATVEYDDSNPTKPKITARLNGNTVVLTIGDLKAYRNNTTLTMDVVPVILNSRTMIPLRFSGEALGANVTWDDASFNVVITTN